WRAGWTVGPRYLVVCAPFFGLGALLSLERLSGRSPRRRALARGAAAGLALAGIVAVGTVGTLVDTLPDTIQRPFAQFFVPMMQKHLSPHDLGECLGLHAGALFYLACFAMLLVPIVLVATPRWRHLPARIAAFAFALA